MAAAAYAVLIMRIEGAPFGGEPVFASALAIGFVPDGAMRYIAAFFFGAAMKARYARWFAHLLLMAAPEINSAW